MISLIQVPYGAQKAILPSLQDHIERALEYGVGEDTFESIKEQLYCQKLELWVFFDRSEQIDVGVVITGFLKYNMRTALDIIGLSCTRPIHEWIHNLDVLDHYALAAGCKHIECTGRKGWQRVLGKENFNEHSVTLVREVVDEKSKD